MGEPRVHFLLNLSGIALAVGNLIQKQLTDLFKKYPPLSITINPGLQLNMDQGASLREGSRRQFQGGSVEEEVRELHLHVVGDQELDAFVVEGVCHFFKWGFWNFNENLRYKGLIIIERYGRF